MAEEILVEQGTLVKEISLVPYIRSQDISFEVDNLRPKKIARMFFDEIAVNLFCQKGNKVILNSRKILGLKDLSDGASAHLNDYVYQGDSRAAATFSARVHNYDSGTKLLTIKTQSGDYNESAPIYVDNVSTEILTLSANVVNTSAILTPDLFYKNEGMICTNNNVYFEAIGTSGEDILYVNENFITVNTNNNLASLTEHYDTGDLVYQTVTGNAQYANVNTASYVGQVMYYNNGTGGTTISLKTLSGSLNVADSDVDAANAVAFLFNASNTDSAGLFCRNVVSYDMEPNFIIRSTENVSKSVVVLSHDHNSGIVANNKGNNADVEPSQTGLNVYVSSANTSTVNGNLMYITAGAGLGQIRRVVAVSGNRVQVNESFDIDPDNTSKYSFGNHIVDNNGTISGIFNVPAEPNFKFETGDRVFSITDTNVLKDPNFTMKASAKFSASALLTGSIGTSPVLTPLPEYNPDNPIAPVDPTDRTYTSTSSSDPVTGATTSTIPTIQSADGLSQTFFTPKPTSNKVNYGIFVTSVDLYFSAKPSTANASLQFPVTVKLTEVKNGFPTKKYLASKTVKAKDVKVSSAPSVSNTATRTKFTFDDPIYLPPDSEYAITIATESPEYSVYIAEMGQDVLGADPPQRISEQPYAGSLFRAQNATTWTNYQNQDLMFVVNKAVFNSTGSATFSLAEPPRFTQNVDRIVIHTNQLSFPTTSVEYGVKGLTKANPNAYENNSNKITPHKQLAYGKLLDYSNKSSFNSRLIKMGNANSVIVTVDFSTSDSDVTPIFNLESATLITAEHDVNNAELSNNVISITNRGIGYNSYSLSGKGIVGIDGTVIGTAPNWTDLGNAAQLFRETFYSNNYSIAMYTVSITGGGGANATGFAVANTTGSNTVDYIVISEGGSGYIENPSIVIANGYATTNVTARAIVNGETGKEGGNIRAKYLTRQIALEDGFESGDLRVFMDVIRPTGTDIQVYYKVLSADDPDKFSDKRWVRMQKKNDRSSKSDQEIIELEYRPNLEENKLYYYENGRKYPIGDKFKYFAIKVCLTAADQAVIPVVRNLRIIATPEG